MHQDRHSAHKTPSIRATVDFQQLLRGCTLLLFLALFLGFLFAPRTGDDSTISGDSANVSQQAAAGETTRLESGCEMIQHVSFTPCGHEMTRRQQLPTELVGKTRSELAETYTHWIITVFSPRQITMERAIGLYCPQHAVLMPDESGQLCVFRNSYGDALALVRELNVPLKDLPDEVQETLRPGKGFDDEDALEKWLESALS